MTHPLKGPPLPLRGRPWPSWPTSARLHLPFPQISRPHTSRTPHMHGAPTTAGTAQATRTTRAPHTGYGSDTHCGQIQGLAAHTGCGSDTHAGTETHRGHRKRTHTHRLHEDPIPQRPAQAHACASRVAAGPLSSPGHYTHVARGRCQTRATEGPRQQGPPRQGRCLEMPRGAFRDTTIFAPALLPTTTHTHKSSKDTSLHQR